MSANGNGQFREDELVSRRVKVGQEWQTRVFPVVGGRLRILHESNDQISIQTEIVRLDNDFVVVKAAVESQRGRFNGTGTASGQRDARLADSLVELAETRAIARALRFGGIGVEYTGAEEVSHVVGEPRRYQDQDKEPESVFPEDKGESKPETKPAGNGKGTVTQAQCRALWALTKKARYTDEDIESILRPLNASTFQELTRESASQLISYLQTEVAA
ncbi:hypothetical protein [Desulfomonile tiedjei]|uniref:Uncharacterized protein n=1 Tax=Desulfomonile tiedjei (strain ATCC 49306 / DSM 6799 / DCB-1) TaxID=706587 RepID=I4CF83_DESTA|nr:hypothetical protein [Desulfomonile tiedjei]AFM28224.1 hypothetical protein Desti_5645 [Desulfomonile tiedjei DSM 6799]